MDANVKLNIFPPLTKEQEKTVTSKMRPELKCALCDCGRVARKKIDAMLRDTRTPDEIWRTLKSEGYSPKLAQNTLDYFKATLNRHIFVCLREDATEYRRALSERLVNERLARELEKQARSLGVEIDNLMKDEIRVIEGIRDELQQDTHTNNGERMETKEIIEPITMKQFKTESSELLPAIFLNTLKQIKLDQEKYLRGEIPTPPDIKAIDSIIKNLTKLIGSAEIADILRES